MTYFRADAVSCMFVYLHTSEKIKKILIRSAGIAVQQRHMKFQFESIPFLNEHTSQYIMLFIKQYLDGVALLEASRQAGISYQKSGVNWASFLRELFKEDLHRSLPHIRLSGEVEIDKSLFGWRTRYHRGRPQGSKVWIFGIEERGSNILVMYPVENRTKETLVPIIQNTLLLVPKFSATVGVPIPLRILWDTNISQ